MEREEGKVEGETVVGLFDRRMVGAIEEIPLGLKLGPSLEGATVEGVLVGRKLLEGVGDIFADGLKVAVAAKVTVFVVDLEIVE